MKKIAALAIVSLMAVSCQQEKTAFVDNEKLIEEYQERKDLEEKYKVKTEAYYKKRDSIRLALNTEYNALVKKIEKLSPQKQQELFAPFQQRGQQIGRASCRERVYAPV